MMSFFGLLVILGAIGAITGKNLDISTFATKSTCGYESCPKISAEKLNVHIVAHTHDDVGWLKTVDQYYYGSKPYVQVAGVQYIIDSVVDALQKDPSRKFIYVETSFLYKWWLRADAYKREILKKLINEGRLEIIGGAWSMNDEATTYYQSIMDQFTWGFRRLDDTFGTCARPKIGWQIDPFGHSREQASIFAQLGFDGLFLGRIDYQDRSTRMLSKTPEFLWEASPSLGKAADLFTVILYNTYSPPPGFCFDILCRDDSIIDDPESTDYNLPKKATELEDYVKKQAKYYNTNNVILTMGGDFTYQNAEMYFQNLDILIKYMNAQKNSSVNIFYSTPSCYLKAVNERGKNVDWSRKDDDFFPYSSDQHAFWTGYFTSRATIKYFERLGNNFLQVAKQLAAKTAHNPACKMLSGFREIMGVMQHHDAVTGTEKQHVARDYARLLHRSFVAGDHISSGGLNKLSKKADSQELTFESCLNLNISSCEVTSNKKSFVVTLYNPTSQSLPHFVRVPVQGNSYSVLDFNGKEVVSQIVPIPEEVQTIPGRVDAAKNELVFKASDLPALGYQSYYVSEKTGSSVTSTEGKDGISSKTYNVSVDSNGQITVKTHDGQLDFTQSFQYYVSQVGNNRIASNRSSGAYIFRPKESTPESFNPSTNFKSYKGPLVEEIHQKINEWVSQVVRIYEGRDHVEFNWMVGPIPIKDDIGKEIITKYKSNLKNNGEFYTDLNGREMLKRKLNYRPTWNLKLEESVAGNYYPLTTKITAQDDQAKLRLSVLIDRAQGGSSLKDGELELMLHRRILHDDAFGVGEPLNETAYGEGLVARGRHVLVGGKLENVDNLILQEKEMATELALQPWIFVTPVKDMTFDQWNQQYKMRGEGLKTQLPKNVKILTLEPWKENQVLLRLEHLFEVNETKEYSTEAKVNIKNLFSEFTIDSVKETTLGGNELKKDNHRLKWGTELNDLAREQTDSKRIQQNADGIIVHLKPMEIRTFIASVIYVKS